MRLLALAVGSAPALHLILGLEAHGLQEVAGVRRVIDGVQARDFFAVCSWLIGTVIGYVSAKAQQVTSYSFGSNKGSKDSGDRIG